jgi:hypothetical protein
MNDAKQNIGVIAFVAVISLCALVAYKIRNIDFSALSSTLDKIKSVLGTPTVDETDKSVDFVTVGVGLLFLLTIVQLFRFKK